MKKQLYEPVREGANSNLLFLDKLQFNKKLQENVIGRYSSNKYNLNVLLLIGGCIVDADYCAFNERLFCEIYHENSLKKIQETKSLLEEKTGWDLKKL